VTEDTNHDAPAAPFETSLQADQIIAMSAEGVTPLLSIDEPEPKKAARADRPPTEGFTTIVDGHFKSEFDTVEAAEARSKVEDHLSDASGRDLRCRREGAYLVELARLAVAPLSPGRRKVSCQPATLSQQPRQIFFSLALVLASSAMKGSL
jgi:hypothetical protein